MARNTLSRAERYHPKGKKSNYNKTVSFLLQFPPALCVSRESPLTDPLAKNLAGMRGRSGSKVCFFFAFISREFPETSSNPKSGEQVSSLCKKAMAKSKHKRANKTDKKKHTKTAIDFGN